jgi:hypothetical protein
MLHNKIIRFYEYPNRETPNQHNPDSSGNPLALHPIFLVKRPEKASFMTQKELKVRGCVLESGFSSNSKTLNKLANTHYNANVHPFVKVIKSNRI